MKNVLLYMLVIILAACGAGSKTIIIPPGNFALKVKEKTTYNNLSVTLTEVQESRCPKDVNCIRAGEAIAVLNITVADKSERNIQLCTGADCSQRALGESYTFSLDEHRYLFKLDSIVPDPGKTAVRGEPVVYFSISNPK